MSAQPWHQPPPVWEERVQQRLVGPADARTVRIASTRMKLGQEVGEIDAFLDQVEMSMGQMLGEIQALRRRIASTDQANEARMYDIRVALEQLLVRLGGPTGQPSGVIDPDGREVPLYSPNPVSAPASAPGWYGPPRGQPAQGGFPPPPPQSPPAQF